MTQRLTVRIFDAHLAIVDELATRPFEHVNGVPCEVHFGPPLIPPARFVSVIPRPRGHTVAWRTTGGMTETFTVRIAVQSEAAWADARSAWLDLQALCAVVAETFRDSDGQPAAFLRDALGLDVLVDMSAVSAVDPAVYPAESGFGAQATIDIPITCRI